MFQEAPWTTQAAISSRKRNILGTQCVLRRFSIHSFARAMAIPLRTIASTTFRWGCVWAVIGLLVGWPLMNDWNAMWVAGIGMASALVAWYLDRPKPRALELEPGETESK